MHIDVQPIKSEEIQFIFSWIYNHWTQRRNYGAQQASSATQNKSEAYSETVVAQALVADTTE